MAVTNFVSNANMTELMTAIKGAIQAGTYSLPTASSNTLGGVKVGSRLSIDANGVLSADAQTYTLPTASASTKGGVKIGPRLTMNGEVLSADEQAAELTTAQVSALISLLS